MTLLTKPQQTTSWLLLLLLFCGLVAARTIPCPGIETAAGNFSAVPFASRPRLARILQHGFQPGLLQATTPSRWLAHQPAVSTHTGFVARPFRTLDSNKCRYRSSEMIRCVRSTMASLASGPGSLAINQFLLEMGLSYQRINQVVIPGQHSGCSQFSTVGGRRARLFGNQ